MGLRRPVSAVREGGIVGKLRRHSSAKLPSIVEFILSLSASFHFIYVMLLLVIP